MRLAPVQRRPRAGFTLIELIVVVTIILILVGLISAAALKALHKADEAKTRHDISQLEQAIGAFQSQFHVPFIPSQFILCENQSDYMTGSNFKSQLHQDSFQYLNRLWPRLNWSNGIDWNGNGTLDGPVLLEGDQCLVFFLGGIPDVTGPTPAVLGFSTNPNNPAAATTDRLGPFFEFQSGRLVNQTSPNNPLHPAPTVPVYGVTPGQWALNVYYSYLDPYSRSPGDRTIQSGQPFAYFSAYNGNRNQYNRYFTASGRTDCQSLYTTPTSQGVWPYAELINTTMPRYQNPSGCQIISAGRDGFFGGGTVITGFNPGTNQWSGSPTWTPSSAADVYDNVVNYGNGPEHNYGYDDMSNFHDHFLGVPK